MINVLNIDAYSIQITPKGSEALVTDDPAKRVPPNEMEVLTVIEDGSPYKISELKQDQLASFKYLNGLFVFLERGRFIDAFIDK